MVYYAAGGYHVVVADLDSIATEVRVALPHGAPDKDAVTVATHALQEGATVAINANYFGGGPNYPCGLARGFGATYDDAYGEKSNCEISLGWARGKGTLFDSLGHEHDASLQPTLTDVVTGGGYLLVAGQPHDWNHAKLEAGRDCSAVGISADRKRFVFVVTDDNVCTGGGLQQVLLQHGAADAIHLDGGGSSKMWIRGKGYVNQEPEDRRPPIVIVARPNGACPSDCGGAQCLALPRPFRAQCLGKPCRAGLHLWNCDEPHLRRVTCASGLVTSEYCAQKCMDMPVGKDDVCLGGAIPEPAPPDMAPAADAAMPVDASVRGDGRLPSPDAPGPGGAGEVQGGCACAITRGAPPGDLLPLALLLAAAAAVGAGSRRRRAPLRAPAAGRAHGTSNGHPRA